MGESVERDPNYLGETAEAKRAWVSKKERPSMSERIGLHHAAQLEAHAAYIEDLEQKVTRLTARGIEDLQHENAALEAKVGRLEAAANLMLRVERRRIYERDPDVPSIDKCRPCPCSGCEGLRAALATPQPTDESVGPEGD